MTGLLILHEQRSHPRSQYASHPAYFKRARSATLSVDMGAPVRCRWLSIKHLQSYRSSNVFFLHSKCKNELGIFVLLFWKVFVGVARDYAEVIEAFFIISLVT